MRFPSLQNALRGAGATLRRFPMSLLSGSVAFAAMASIIEHDGNNPWAPRLLAVAAMGLPLFTAARTTAERRRTGPPRLWMTYAVLGSALVALYALSLGWPDQLTLLRMIQLLLLAHLAAAAAPYIGIERPNGFWQYNRFLLLRFLEATFYSAALFVGLAIALGALDKLFGVNVSPKAYFHLFAALSFVFHPWFFLAGVPADFEALDAREDYPQGLKVFSQFVLIPLVTVYLAILTAYLGKVVFTRTWPSGWIGYLVSSVSTTGVLALLLVDPIRKRGDTPWVNVYARWWFVALLPALVMLLLAVSKRMEQYGITEERYFLIALTFWMLGISLYYGVTGSTNIKQIPETLLLVVALTAVGPWGAYAVSERSQVARLGSLLAFNGMGAPGHITPHRSAISDQDRAQISAVFLYLASVHGPAAVGRVVGVSRDSVESWALSTAPVGVAMEGMRRLDLEYVDRWSSGVDNASFYGDASEAKGIDVAGFEVARSFRFPLAGWIGSATDSLELARDSVGGAIVITHDHSPVMSLDLVTAVRAALARDSLGSVGKMKLSRPVVLEGAGGGYRVRVVLTNIFGAVTGKTLKVNGASGLLMASGFRPKP